MAAAAIRAPASIPAADWPVSAMAAVSAAEGSPPAAVLARAAVPASAVGLVQAQAQAQAQAAAVGSEPQVPAAWAPAAVSSVRAQQAAARA